MNVVEEDPNPVSGSVTHVLLTKCCSYMGKYDVTVRKQDDCPIKYQVGPVTARLEYGKQRFKIEGIQNV